MGALYLKNSFSALFCKIGALLEKYMEKVHFLSKFARKKSAALLKMASFIGFFMV